MAEHPHKADINQFWKSLVDGGSEIDVGMSEQCCIDETWANDAPRPEEHRFSQPIVSRTGFELLSEKAVYKILYKKNRDYRCKTLRAATFSTRPEAPPN